MDKINIQFTLFSAFYSPLISTMSGGFLKAEGLDPQWSISPPGVSALAALKDGSAHVVQSALSQGFTSLDKGETPAAVHFAQVNEMDGFFLTGREADPAFTWDKLEGAEVVMFKGGQPLAMFKYACHKAGIDFGKISPSAPAAPPRSTGPSATAQGQYVQQQGPFPQQLQADGVGHVVAQVGKQIGPCGFSSLAATRDWLETDMAKAFMRAYRKTRVYMNETPAAEIAKAEKPYFPDIDEDVLADCIATYQKLGCWTPHVEITRAAYEKNAGCLRVQRAVEAALSLRAGLYRTAGNRLRSRYEITCPSISISLRLLMPFRNVSAHLILLQRLTPEPDERISPSSPAPFAQAHRSVRGPRALHAHPVADAQDPLDRERGPARFPGGSRDENLGELVVQATDFQGGRLLPLGERDRPPGGILGEDAHFRVLPEQLDGHGVDLVGIRLEQDRGGVHGSALSRTLELPGDAVDHLQGFPGDEHPLRVRQTGGQEHQNGREQQDPWCRPRSRMHGASSVRPKTLAKRISRGAGEDKRNPRDGCSTAICDFPPPRPQGTAGGTLRGGRETHNGA